MAKVIAGITMSLDGYITGPDNPERATAASGSTTGSSAGPGPTTAARAEHRRRPTRPTSTASSGETIFEFVTDGIDGALARARAAAGGKNVVVMGGADLLRQYLEAGLVHEFTLTIAPVLLGGGKRLFDGIARTDITFERTAVVESPFATHLRFSTP